MFFFPRGGYDMVNQNFKVQGQYLHCVFLCVPLSGFCLHVQISQMKTNIYSANVGASCTSDASHMKVFVGAAGCSVQALRSCRAQGQNNCISASFVI